MNDSLLKIPDCFLEKVCAPGHPTLRLHRVGDAMVASDSGREVAFPIVQETPILINDSNSVFRVSDFLADGVTAKGLHGESQHLDTTVKRLKSTLSRLVPKKSWAVADLSPQTALSQILERQPDAKILVVGAGDVRFTAESGAAIVYTDVALAANPQLIADAHDIPFVDGVFDAVFAVAVLEHVADPYRCVDEFRRVLKPRGLVYAVTPFMQQVHMGRYDFTRFTAVGHRRLFRWFDDLGSGVANGPGMAVSWSIEYWLSSFSEQPTLRSLLRTGIRFLVWPFLLLDGVLARKAGSYDCASAFYFFGKLRDSPVENREIVAQYKGLNR